MITGPFEEVSNRADFTDVIEVHDGDTHELIDITGASIQIEVGRQTRPPWGSGDIVLRASTDDGSITILSTNVFDFIFPVEKMRALEPGNYDVGVTIKRDGRTAQQAIGSLPVVDGIVRTSQ
jgi:hypothetical protein